MGVAVLPGGPRPCGRGAYRAAWILRRGHVGAAAEPVLDRHDPLGLVGGKVRDEEADRPGMVGHAFEDQGELAFRDRAPPPGARVGRDLLGGHRHPPGDRVGAGREPRRGVAGSGDRGIRERGGEEAGVGADPRRGAHRAGQHPQRPAQQADDMGPGILVAGEQVRGQGQAGARPARQQRPARASALVGVGDAAFLTAVDLHVRGIEVERRAVKDELGAPLGGQPVEIPPRDLGQPGLDPGQLGWSEPFGESGRGPRRGERHRREQRPGRVRPRPVQPRQRRLAPSWLVAIPTSSSPAPKPRARCLTGPIPASSAPTVPSRSTSSCTATSPADPVTDGSTGPIRTRSRRHPRP